ncbi:MAG: 30S ribosomal protein S3 [Kiritimatiellia bacterium]|nr:30S ribosomal protein S3 [Kiritimatiellia bacterium]
MGQKVHPVGMRLAVRKNWSSRWYAGKKEYGTLAFEDAQIREEVKNRLKDAAVPDVLIERYANRVRVTVLTARPGIVIGRKGQDVEQLREKLAKTTGRDVYIEIKEIRNADCHAQLVAENIALQMERRVSFRRAMKRAAQVAMEFGAQGIRMHLNGRLGGSELARSEGLREGKVPLHTLREDIDDGFAEAQTVAGKIGVKVWICHKPEEAGKEADHAAYA